MYLGNKQCHARFVKKCQEKHRQKLTQMKCSIDNQEPKRHPHLHKNAKKAQLMEERYAEIERDNRLLLEKMSFIMRHQKEAEEALQVPRLAAGQSLNREQRKRELQRITRENQNILCRIQAAEPTLDHLAWLEHEKQHKEYMKRVCELPIVIHDGLAQDDDDEQHPNF